MSAAPSEGGWASSAAVPEQVAAYVCAVSDLRPLLVGACAAYLGAGRLVLVGYPLHDPMDSKAAVHAVDQALARPEVRRITVISATRAQQAPADAPEIRDEHLGLTLPVREPASKLRSLIRRAAREVDVTSGREWSPDHEHVVGRYLDRPLAAGTRHIFSRVGRYLEASPSARLVSARRHDRVAAFAVGEFGSRHTAFYMFSFRDPDLAPPGAADLLLGRLLEEAGGRGQARLNLGLGVDPGIAFFKRKWGAAPFLPYVEVSWEIRPQPLVERIGRLLGW